MRRGTGDTADGPDLRGRLPGWRARWTEQTGRHAIVLGEERLVLFARHVPRRVPTKLLDVIEARLAGGDPPHCRDRAPLGTLPAELTDADVTAGDGDGDLGLGGHDADAG